MLVSNSEAQPEWKSLRESMITGDEVRSRFDPFREFVYLGHKKELFMFFPPWHMVPFKTKIQSKNKIKKGSVLALNNFPKRE